MGGHSGGEVASSIAVKTVEDVFQNPPRSNMTPKEILTWAYSESSRRIYDKAANENPELMGMGTTMVAIAHSQGKFLIGNVGDSRIYLYRKPNLWQLTEDHSLVNEQLKAGLISEDQVETFVGRNVITRSVGYERDVLVDILERAESKGDLFLLCSDGLSGMVKDEQILEILNRSQPDEMVDKLLEAALAQGGDDNVTVMVVALT
jgi:serine/threonine protein phosphatase PrpC